MRNSKKNNSCFCIPGLQENSDILRLRLFWDWECEFVDILVGFPDAVSAFNSRSLLRGVSETSCSSWYEFVLWLLSISIEGFAKTSFDYNYNLSLNLKAQSIPGHSSPGRKFVGHILGCCIPGIEAQRLAFCFSARPYFLLALARLPPFSHLVNNRQKWFLRMLFTKIPSRSSVMSSILSEALLSVSKELRTFRESSVATKWRKHAIAGIMCV